MSDLEPLASFLDDTVFAVWDNPDQRHPVLRTGEREPIPAHLRAAVWFRDQGICAHCHTGQPVDSQPWHLDHITPWSAGGADDSTNLRVLCETHNMARGNAVDHFARPARPVTWWCINCFGEIPEDQPQHHWMWTTTGHAFGCPIHWNDPRRCRVIRAFERALQTTGTVDDWHRRDAIDDPTTVAYCAHCDTYAFTDRPL